jgi:hypothetical protein
MAGTLPLKVIALSLIIVGCGGGAAESIKTAPMPEGGDFTGVYHSPQYGEMNLVQTGNSVVGEYRKDERAGRINGSVEGNLLKFDWIERRALVLNKPVESKGKGYFHYLIDPANNEHVLKGEWGNGDQRTGGGPWNAWKSLRAKPQLSGGSEGTESGGTGSGSQEEQTPSSEQSPKNLDPLQGL